MSFFAEAGDGGASFLAGTKVGGAGPGATASCTEPRRRKMRCVPSRKSISLRSCWVISATSALTVRTSNGPGFREASSATGFSLLFGERWSASGRDLLFVTCYWLFVVV